MKTLDTPKSVVDPVITEVRRHKREIAAEHDYDVVALGRSLQEREAKDPRFQVLVGEEKGRSKLPQSTKRDHVDY